MQTRRITLNRELADAMAREHAQEIRRYRHRIRTADRLLDEIRQRLGDLPDSDDQVARLVHERALATSHLGWRLHQFRYWMGRRQGLDSEAAMQRAKRLSVDDEYQRDDARARAR
jgi:hypothetical protein